jgi:iron complex transport system permease protein
VKSEVEQKSLPPGELYSRFTGRKALFILASLALLAVVALVATSLGGASLGIGDVFRAVIAGPPSGVESNPVDLDRVIVWHLRLPRIVMGIIAGAGLAIAGAAMQGVLRNPLVSPFTLGVSSGATLGASIAIILGFSLVGSGRYVVIANAFVFAMGTSLLILAIGRLRGITPESFILVGIALMYFFGAFTSFLQYVATEGELAEVVHWAFGSLTGSKWGNIGIVSAIMLGCLPWLLKYSWDLNAMAQGGDEVAQSLGVNCGRVRVISMTLAALVTATIICFTGIIGFVCLVAPHITRLLIGGDHRFLLPCSCVLGAALLLAADAIGRTVISPTIIPVGIVISFIGAPFFFYLLMTRRRQYWQ